MPIPQMRRRQIDGWKNQVVGASAPSNPNRSKKTKKINKWKIIKFLVILAAAFLVIAFIAVAWISRDLPNPNQLINREVAQSTKIYDRTGENILYEIHGDQKRTLISLSDLPEYVKWAPIAIEDKSFYNHGGFSVWAMFRTAITDVLYGQTAGGSTLTQQFIKNAVLTPEKKITRKIKELVLAYRLEQRFSKDEILQMYLNEIPYGSNAYGIEAASEKYFGKHAKDISLAEAALLAALTQAPSRYSPYGSNKDFLLGRKDYVLTLMREQGHITEEQELSAKAEEIKFMPPEVSITAPHFVMYIKDILAEKYGEKMIEQDGLKIYTTLDLYKQQIAEEVIKEKTEKYQEKYNANNAALVSIDPKTGQILAMVGSRDYFNDDIDGQVNVALSSRQPGSSIKPIVYAALFKRGYSPDTILYDVNTNFSSDPANPYQPRDYDLKERGPISIRKALAGSLNTPAVKALYLAGINNVLDLADSLGYSTFYPRDRFGLAFVLGGAEVKLVEHVNAFSAFARDGQMSPIVSILKIEDKNGKVIEEYKVEEKKVLEPQIARMINSVLSDNSARAFIFGEKNNLVLGGRPVAAKTGTTNDYHDAWTIGYTPSIVTGVWVGNTNNDKMKGVADGSVVAAPIWNTYMSRVLGNTPFETFKAPDEYKSGKGIVDGQLPSQTVKIDVSTGQLATSQTPPELTSELVVPEAHSILFFIDKDNPLGPQPEHPENDPQFNLWESAVTTWAEKNASSSLLLKDYNALHKPENNPSLTVTEPKEGATITDYNLSVVASAIAPRGVSRFEYYINGNLWKTSSGNNGSISGSLPPLANGYQSLTVKACDDVDNCAEQSLNFNLKISGNNNAATEHSIFISSPTNGTSANAIDFPLKINLNIVGGNDISRVLVFAKNNDNQKLELIANLGSISESTTNLSWDKVPASGSYTIYGELKSWGGDSKTSNEVKISVTN
ncbi:MAG: penicillin-binding protein [Patescibacteria group bacterium]